MRKAIVIIGVLSFATLAYGQKRGDLGVFFGGSYYLGEINPTVQFLETSPAYGLMYRQIFDLRWSLRGSIYKGTLTGDDRNSDYDYHQRRGHTFSLDIVDFALMTEFNFLPYVSTSSKYNFAPYVTAGVSYMMSQSDDVKNTLTIPFGIGFKVNVTERVSAGVEWVWRNSFSDELDGLGDWETDPLQEEFMTDQTAENYRQKSLIYRNDMYAYAGFFVCYKIAYRRIKCPAYGEADMVE